MFPNFPFMDLSMRKSSKRTIEPVDEWLQSDGYYRKNAPKDPTCLFRAVGEQVYRSQRDHIRVRKECVEFMKKNRKFFEEKISIPLDNYLDQMACFTEWGTMNEVLAMSMLFKRNVVIFHGQKMTKETAIDHGYKDSLFLCFTPPKQYETVQTKQLTADAGFCQSIVYQTLYKRVFGMDNVDATVNKMLHEKTNNLGHNKFFLRGNMEMRGKLSLDLMQQLENPEESEEMQNLAKGITPFPYRVAKALDPDIYRNIDIDVWHEIRRDVRNSGFTKFNSCELQAGAKCLVHLELREVDLVNNNCTTQSWDINRDIAKPKGQETIFTGHIQELGKNEGPAVVFIEELGQKMTVPFEALKPLPQRRYNNRPNNWIAASNKKNMMPPANTKWKRPWTPNGRKAKDVAPVDNNNDKKQPNNNKANGASVLTKSEWSVGTTVNNHPVTVQSETYTSYKEYEVNQASVDNVRAVLENTHISSVEEQTSHLLRNTVASPDMTCINNDIIEEPAKRGHDPNQNYETNQTQQQPMKQNRRVDNEMYYPPQQNGIYAPHPQFYAEPGMINYDMMKTPDFEGAGPYTVTDPATGRPYYNVGVKYIWQPNAWSNGINGPPAYPENTTYYVMQPPPSLPPPSPGVNLGPHMMNVPAPKTENYPPVPPNSPNEHARQNHRSTTPRMRDQESGKANGPKPNYRNAGQSTSHQPLNSDANKNRNDYKNSNSNDQQQQQQQQGPNNREQQRNNKSNNTAPRFKRNYDGRGRNDHQNGQYQYRQSMQHQENDYRYNNRKPLHHQQHHHQHQQQQQQQYQQHNSHMVQNHQIDGNEMGHMQHQQQNVMQQQQQQQLQQQQQQQSGPMAFMNPQSPPPMNAPVPYPIYTAPPQMPFVQMGTYPVEADGYPGHFYPAPPNFIPISYMPPPQAPPGELQENGPSPPQPGPMYSGPIENYPQQYPPLQYITFHPPPPPPPPAMYQNQQAPAQPPPGIIPGGDNNYPPPGLYPGQPYFMSYPPPPPQPMGLASPQQNVPPAH